MLALLFQQHKIMFDCIDPASTRVCHATAHRPRRSTCPGRLWTF